MFWLNFGTFANLDKFISRFNWKGRICGSKSTQIWSISICQVKSMAIVRFRSFSDILYKSWGRGETKRGLQEESKWVYGMERESKEGLDNIDGSQPSPQAPVWSLCRGWCQIRHQPPLMTFLRLLRITGARGAGAWSRREGTGSGPSLERSQTIPSQSPAATSYFSFIPRAWGPGT